MTLAATDPEHRICFIDCGKSAPECHCKARLSNEYRDFVNTIQYGPRGNAQDE
jgi:hypothetical protein